jgi:spermidine/putrescine transport system ATP-binding protein
MLEVVNIWKNYEGTSLLQGVSFSVAQAETICLLGSSGSGKSTLLNIISGLELPENGKIIWGGEDLAGVPVHLRNFGLMFQEYALFPHRNVQENVAFGLRMQGLKKSEINQRVHEALDQVNLADFASRRVTDLSGGEQQRVALARALAPRPKLLMLDEPLGALDRNLREQLILELRGLLKTTRIPTIYVTHDQEEAFTIADRLVLLNEGKVAQAGTPDEVYNSPVSIWVARFLGLNNILEGLVISLQPLQVSTEAGVLQSSCRSRTDLSLGDQVTLLLRPSGASLEGDMRALNRIEGEVEDVVFRGEGYRCDLRCASGKNFRFYLENALPVGSTASLFLSPDMILCLV